VALKPQKKSPSEEGPFSTLSGILKDIAERRLDFIGGSVG